MGLFGRFKPRTYLTHLLAIWTFLTIIGLASRYFQSSDDAYRRRRGLPLLYDEVNHFDKDSDLNFFSDEEQSDDNDDLQFDFGSHNDKVGSPRRSHAGGAYHIHIAGPSPQDVHSRQRQGSSGHTHQAEAPSSKTHHPSAESDSYRPRTPGQMFPSSRSKHTQMNRDDSRSIRQEKSGQPKVIGKWDSFNKNPSMPFATDMHFSKCPVSNCRVAKPGENVNDLDVLLVNFREHTLLDDPEQAMPKRTRSNQLFVFYNQESPIRSEHSLGHEAFKDKFNLTMTYREDSDIPIPYYEVKERPAPHKFHYNFDGKKKKLAIWVISRCGKHGSERWNYAEELAEYVPVDIYGACTNRSCPEETCLAMAKNTYKFYLSFENAMCRDYVTEKITKPLLNHIVPVALGSVDYGSKFPPHSVINIRDFDSPRQLADHLLHLDKNDDVYMKYFKWNDRYTVSGKVSGLCELCRVVNDPGYDFRSKFDPYSWWVEDGECLPQSQQKKILGL